MAKTDQEAGHKGISIFLIPTDIDGYSTEPINNTMGLNCSPLAEVILDDVEIPEENVVGEVNQGFYYLMEGFEIGRVHVAAQGVGTAQAALESSIEYANERKRFGKYISEIQAIQHKIGYMATMVEASRALTYYATEMVESDFDNANSLAIVAVRSNGSH